MTDSQKDAVFSFPVIDVPATSKNLKKLRESHGISVANLQQLLDMANPQSIYTIDDLIVLKKSENVVLSISESRPPYGFTTETLDYIRINSSKNVRIALGKYFDLTF